MLIDISCKLKRIDTWLKALYFDLPILESERLALDARGLLEGAGRLGSDMRRLDSLHDGELISFRFGGGELVMEIEDIAAAEAEGHEGAGAGAVPRIRVRISGIRRFGYYAVKRGGRISLQESLPRFGSFLRASLIAIEKGRIDIALVFSVPGPSRFRYFPFLELEAEGLEIQEAP